MTEASAAAASLRATPFAFAFQHALSFPGKGRRPWVLCDGEDTGALIAFQRALVVALAAGGIARVDPPPSSYRPHVTLGYDSREIAARPVEAVRWDVAEFVLIHSRQGASRYEVLGRWELPA